MASRYWVGGTGTWDASDTSHWAASTGGASGVSVPTSSDNVFFDGSSGAGTVTMSGTRSCADLTCTGYTGTLTGAAPDVYGSLTLAAGMTLGQTAFSFKATSTGKTITTAGKDVYFGMVFDGVGGGWTLQDALTCTLGGITLSNGSLDLNGKTISNFDVNISGTGTRTLTCGASSFTCTRNWTATTTTNLTFNAGTSTVIMSGTGSNDCNFSGGGLSYYNVTFSNVTGYQSRSLLGNFTCSGTFTATGNNASTQRMYVKSDTAGTARTITAAVVSLTNVDFEDITAAGVASPFTGTSIGNCGGNTNITQTTPVTAYWVHAGAASRIITDALWFTASGGAVASRFPLPQDTGIIDANSGTSGKTITIGTSGLRLGTINFTGAASSTTLSLDQAALPYGSLTLASGVTMSGSSTLTFKGRSSNTLTSAGKTFGGGITLDAVGGTLTPQDALTASGALTVTNGTFNANNFNVTCSAFSSTNTNTRTVTMGSGTWTLSGTGGWNTSTTTNLTLTANTSTISVPLNDGANRFMYFSDKTIYNLTWSGSGNGGLLLYGTAWTCAGTLSVTSTGTGSLTFNDSSGTVTVNNLTVSGKTGSAQTFTGSGSQAVAITGNLTFATGTAFINGITSLSFTATSSKTITMAGNTVGVATTFNGAGGTWTLQDNFTSSSTVTLTQGTLALGTYTMQATTFASTNTNTRAITGTGTIIVTSTGTVWDTTTITNMTMGSQVTLKINNASATDKTVITGGLSKFHVTLSGGGSGLFKFQSSANYFNRFYCDFAGAGIRFKASSTTTVDAWDVNGASGTNTTLTDY